ncbi:amidoligase family protein [Clavibacter sp. Sh2141]|uniref:amidoligase family protein n=1 Tax=Clavibacter sp. Sh2141 TaxID=3395374 RepID=UPI0039BD238F
MPVVLARHRPSGADVTELRSRIGFEIELIAPPGASRLTLAERIAAEHGGRITRFFHTDSEPSLVPGMGHFWHLTPGFDVRDRDGGPLATLVDDITIVADLRREQVQAAAQDPGHRPGAGTRERPDPDLYRVLSDDPRLLRLVADRTDAAAPYRTVLDDAAELFGTAVETIGPVRRLRDRAGASIAMATALAYGRERPCEIVTPPLRHDHEAALEALLRPARAAGFGVPAEAAVHLHLDAAPFRSTAAFANLVRLFGHWREPLRAELETNPACVRLQALPPALLELVDADADATDSGAAPSGEAERWRRMQGLAAATGLTKYFDVNLTALLTDQPSRDTVEVRILPGALHGAEIARRAELVERLLARCLRPEPLPRPSTDDPGTARAELRRLAGLIPSAENARPS